MKRKILLICHFLIFYLQVLPVYHAQKQTNKWYFGEQVALDFNSNPPNSLNNSAMSAFACCSSISDAAGNLLFYTNGATVWNQAHQVMANGSSLGGQASSSQGALIVKQPGNANIYYIFCNNAIENLTGFKYSVVDMNLAAGMGSVTVLNAPLYGANADRLAGVKHCNGNDVWVMIHDLNDNKFRAFLLTSIGVSTAPVTSTTGINCFTALQNFGVLKFSPNGRKLLHSVFTCTTNPNNTGRIELFDFDNSTGLVSNPILLAGNTNYYACEFSPDGTKAYAIYGLSNKFSQWDLCVSNATTIAATEYSTSISLFTNVSQLQLGSDGKIYYCTGDYQNLSVINNPNLQGSACNFSQQALSVSTGTCKYGMPNFVSSYFKPNGIIQTTVNCQNALLQAPAHIQSSCAAADYPITALLWNFGDPVSGTTNSSSQLNPSHIFSSTGTFTASLIVYRNCSNDTFIKIINVATPGPGISLTGATTICKGESTNLSINGVDTYSWSNGAMGNSLVVSPSVSTFYTVTATNSVNGCYTNQVIQLTVNKCLGLENVGESSADHLRLFPNPFSDNFTLETINACSISVSDNLGQKVYNDYSAGGTKFIRLQNLEKGMYFIEIRGENFLVRKVLIKIE